MNPPSRTLHETAGVTLPYAAACASGTRAAASGAAGCVSRLDVGALTGTDELAIDEALAEGASANSIATLLIARCASLAGKPLGESHALAMALGDREVVLRGIYAASFGPRFVSQIACAGGCAEAIEFDVDLAGLTQAVPEAGPVHRHCIDGSMLELRVPTGADLERALGDGADPASLLAAACAGGADVDPERLSTELARLDPNAECIVALACPECGTPVEAVLDAMELVRITLAEGGGFLAQVDLLARAYGWTEAEVLALPRARRLRYCAMAEAGAAA